MVTLNNVSMLAFSSQQPWVLPCYLFLPVCYRMIPVTLVLKDPHHPEQDLGSLELAVTLTPKDSPLEERRDSTVRSPHSSCKMTFTSI